MTRRSRRRRAVVLLALAVASGGLAASEVGERESRVEAQVGLPVPVAVAREEIPPGTKLTARRVARLIEVREVPERFAPPDALAVPADAVGLTTAGALAPGSYVTAAAFAAADQGPGIRTGERALELRVANGGSLPGAGARVDVLVTTEPRAGSGRTFVALEMWSCWTRARIRRLRPPRAGRPVARSRRSACRPARRST